MKFIFFTFDGASLPIAKQLKDEGNEVIVGQVTDNDILVGWMGDKQTREEKKRRLSVYDGILDKLDPGELSAKMRAIANKGSASEWFVLVDHNQLYKYAERYARWGFTGLLPTEADFCREKERIEAQKFVRANYRDLKVNEAAELKKISDGISLIEKSDNLWVLKSNGNIGETIVPATKNVSLNHQQIIGALKKEQRDYEKECYLLERKISDPIEFAPVMVFWNGSYVYSHVELECKNIGAGDTGADGGGSINLVVRTSEDSPINEMFFPPIISTLAEEHKGLFIFDAGILYDPEDRQYYFTEFAGNRWGWGGIFSEMVMSNSNRKQASKYFSSVTKGDNPLTYKYGATVTLFNIVPDSDHPKIYSQDMPVYCSKSSQGTLYLFQIKNNGGGIVNVGMDNWVFGYASGYGNTITAAINRAYEAVDSLSLDRVMFRPKHDFYSIEYPSSILNRLSFLHRNELI